MYNVLTTETTLAQEKRISILSQKYHLMILMDEEAFANDFFCKPNQTINSHEEWLLREFSRLMHREALVRQRESKFLPQSSSRRTTENGNTRSDTQHND